MQFRYASLTKRVPARKCNRFLEGRRGLWALDQSHNPPSIFRGVEGPGQGGGLSGRGIRQFGEGRPQREGSVEWKGGHQWRFVQRMAVGPSFWCIRVGSKPLYIFKARQNAACRSADPSNFQPNKFRYLCRRLSSFIVEGKEGRMRKERITGPIVGKIRRNRSRPYSYSCVHRHPANCGPRNVYMLSPSAQI
jgi:hypothetical protein